MINIFSRRVGDEGLATFIFGFVKGFESHMMKVVLLQPKVAFGVKMFLVDQQRETFYHK